MILALLTQVPRLHPAASEPLRPLTFLEVMAGICLSLVPYAGSFPLRSACIPQEPKGMGGRLVRRPESGVEARRWFGDSKAVWRPGGSVEADQLLGSGCNMPVSQGRVPTVDL